jgi:hypothetical protein
VLLIEEIRGDSFQELDVVVRVEISHLLVSGFIWLLKGEFSLT